MKTSFNTPSLARVVEKEPRDFTYKQSACLGQLSSYSRQHTVQILFGFPRKGPALLDVCLVPLGILAVAWNHMKVEVFVGRRLEPTV